MNLREKISIFFKFIKIYWASLVLILTPLLLLPLAASGNKPIQCGYVICVVAVFWITEIMNLAVTSLIPIVLFPAFGILKSSDIAKCYMKEVTIMLMGGLIVAKAMEKQNLHRRLALNILKLMGPNPIFQYMGFMIATWFLSMWISNTATSAMMITLAEAVVDHLKIMSCQMNNHCVSDSVDEKQVKTEVHLNGEIVSQELQKIELFGKGLFLSIAYSAASGGIASLPGTGPNLIFYGFVEERYGSRMNLNFATFMAFGLPLSIMILVITWLLLCIRYIGLSSTFKREKNSIKDSQTMNLIDREIEGLGPISFGEVSISVLFFILILLWVLREPGTPLFVKLFTYQTPEGTRMKYWVDAMSAILAAIFVFILPAKNPFKIQGPNEKLSDWKYIEHELSWGLIFLFGGGFALAAGCEASGLSTIIGNCLTYLDFLPHFWIILIISLTVSFLTEITSNSATATILLPIIFKMSECIRMHPMILGLSTTMACSFSFCLPAATPPNAIVFSTGKLRVLDMVSCGIVLNTVCVLLLSVMTYYYSVFIFKTNVYPEWIGVNCSNT